MEFDLMEFVYSIMVVVNQGKSQRQRQRLKQENYTFDSIFLV